MKCGFHRTGQQSVTTTCRSAVKLPKLRRLMHSDTESRQQPEIDCDLEPLSIYRHNRLPVRMHLHATDRSSRSTYSASFL